jgi:hypothetical protein
MHLLQVNGRAWQDVMSDPESRSPSSPTPSPPDACLDPRQDLLRDREGRAAKTWDSWLGASRLQQHQQQQQQLGGESDVERLSARAFKEEEDQMPQIEAGCRSRMRRWSLGDARQEEGEEGRQQQQQGACLPPSQVHCIRPEAFKNGCSNAIGPSHSSSCVAASASSEEQQLLTTLAAAHKQDGEKAAFLAPVSVRQPLLPCVTVDLISLLNDNGTSTGQDGSRCSSASQTNTSAGWLGAQVGVHCILRVAYVFACYVCIAYVTCAASQVHRKRCENICLHNK